MEKLCGEELVHINRLPDDLVKKILECLPIEDAIRTSILSKKWRYTWTKLHRLIFNDTSCERLITKTESYKITMAIYQVLLLHSGPLDVFELSLSNLKCSPDIDLIVLVVLKSGVTEFTLTMPEGEPYGLPSSIFVYGQQLEDLCLCFCVLKPPMGFNGFYKLKILFLREVDISGSAFSSLISNCPLLEYLTFTSFTSCGRLDIIAPNLKDFVFEGLCDSMCFKNTPRLASVWIDDSALTRTNYSRKIGIPPSECMLSGRLPVVKELTLDHVYSEHMVANKTTSLVNDLCHLRVLTLAMSFEFLDEVSTAVFLVNNAKNLEKLVMLVDSETTGSDVELKQVKGFSDITFESLKKFELKQAFGSKCELQFIELILARSPVLNFCIIQPNTELIGEKGCMFFQQLSRFRRASPHVDIAYEDSDEDSNED